MKTIKKPMGRRQALAAMMGLALSRAVGAEQAPKAMKRLGLYCHCDVESFARFKQELEKRGWVEGKNIELVLRALWNADPAQFPALAREVVAARPDVLLTYRERQTRTLREATSTIPIVTTVSDPVADGFAVSLSRPGRNVTGLIEDPGLTREKRIELLHRLIPALETIVLLTPGTKLPDERKTMPMISIARARGLKVTVLAAGTTLPDYEAVLAKVPSTGRVAVLAIYVPGESYEDVPRLALRYRIPMCFQERALVEAGGLASFALEHADPYGRLIAFVDKILRGASPADLPFELPNKTDLALNRGTAAALGIQIPPDLLVRADAIFG